MSSVVKFPAAPVAEEQGAERLARALALGVAADDELAALRGLDLEPQARALARFVLAVFALGDGALEAARKRRRIQGFTVLPRVHELHVGGGQEALREPAPAVGV